MKVGVFYGGVDRWQACLREVLCPVVWQLPRMKPAWDKLMLEGS